MVSHCDLAGWSRRIEAAHLILVVNFYWLAERSDLDNGDSISDEPNEANGLRYVAVDPLLIASTVWIAALLLAHLVLRSAERSAHHAMVHPDQNLMSGNGVLQHRRKSVGVGLLGGLHSEVDERFKQRLDLGAGYFRNPSLKHQGNA